MWLTPGQRSRASNSRSTTVSDGGCRLCDPGSHGPHSGVTRSGQPLAPSRHEAGLITSDTTTMRCTAFYRWYLPVWLLQVWFTAVYSGQVNVALNKKYSQSSFRSFDDRRPENAANDNTDGTFRDNNCIRTSSSDDNPWWEVDLGQVYPVLKLTIYGCSGYESHLESSIITVDGRECVRITSMPSRAINISCSSTLYGRTIRISKCPVKNLMMCEFQVWGQSLVLVL
ncbi:hypothetical protein C0Q70_15785 [Pomacea canaliculata]|uniref:Fucolectin tachylectin-4 pentraxin-1 domain-containing protein n=1 Tax=Pomacea canaliculata TaxID=400727 RepID=A0A2T7NVU2_POMCA|nr:hypothetical protein C0Q70_15785 [Pomacea canaliculata]